jgi:ABC-type glycerol-3-phosphate transport system permease component
MMLEGKPMLSSIYRKKILFVIRRTVVYIALIFVVILTLAPLLWALASSFTPNEMIYKYACPFSPRAFLPVNATLEAYYVVLTGKPGGEDTGMGGTGRGMGAIQQIEPMGRSILNSLGLSVGRVVLGVIVSGLAGFALAKMSLPGKRFWFAFILIPFLVPGAITLVPAYILVTKMRMLNTYAVILLPGIADSMMIFLFRQFFHEVPAEMLDAAKVDGASWTTIMTRIVAPLSKPVIVSGGLLLFLGMWNNFFWPLLVAPSDRLRVVQVAIALMNIGRSFSWNLVFAGSVIAILIPVLLFLPFQRYYVAGIANTGLKG